MDQLEKKIKAVDTYAKKYKKQLVSRPVLNQIKVIDGKAYFSDGCVAFYFNDIFPESVPLNNYTFDQVDGYYPDNIDRLIPIMDYFQVTEHKLSELLASMKNDKKNGLWKDTVKDKTVYHVINGKPIVGKDINYHNINPRRFYHVLNCLKKFGEKTIEISLNPNRVSQTIVITGKETGIRAIFCPLRVL